MHNGSHQQKEDQKFDRRAAFWRANLRLLGILFAIWFAVSFGAGILFADALNRVVFFGFPLGFWFAQQGAIYVFIVLIFVYAAVISGLERRYGREGGEPHTDEDQAGKPPGNT